MNKEEINNELRKYFIDISKLIFGGVVIATIIKVGDVGRLAILLLGMCSTVIFAIVGFQLLKGKK